MELEGEERVEEVKPKKSRKKQAIIVLAVILVLAVAGFVYSSNPSFCNLCHEIKPYYASWAKSAHQNVNCIVCHSEPGFLNFLKHKFGSWNYIFVHLLFPDKPVKLKRPIPNESCEICHSANRVVSPGGDLVIPHQHHVEFLKLRCSDCHHNLHTTLEAGESEETTKVGAAYYHPVCWEKCHDGIRATNKCNACHTRKALPPSHRQADFSRLHGVTYPKKEDCAKCHGYTKDFCRDCHKKKPTSHLVGNYKATHRFDIAKKGLRTCQACHAEDNICLRCHD